MNRDMELVRKLLFFFDEKPDSAHVKIPPIEGYDDLAIRYHVVLMYQAGLISGEPQVTWIGHELGAASFAAMKTAIASYAQQIATTLGAALG